MERIRKQLRLSRTSRTRRLDSMDSRFDRWQSGTAIAGILSVLLVGIGLVLTNDFNRDQLKLQQRTAQEQQDLALKGQRADRFVQAVDQLGQEGEDKLGVRLGGIYALEALMNEFRADENVVIEVLCAFVRSHAPYKKGGGIGDATQDVRSAVTVLGRRPDPDAHLALDFTNTMLGLDRLTVPDASFRGADLSIGDFSDAVLPRADLREASFRYSYLDGAELRGANLEDAYLYGTKLRGAILPGANLRNVDFSEAVLTGADLTGADLTGPRTKGLTTAQLACAKVDAATRLPAGVSPPAPDAWKQKKCAVEDD
ncbi:pentapeptide repeat-containing protein [Actinoplanes sp. M2I2]|uniref:pentapeptide repeat-containing protein n=1 Tax=Actinoplanes sp. M2I2 TaxID=1734444 RepID=UPI0020202E0D|nr:pentapeptide repeat-containing protein [Actinoplanes sp. M2I2]